MQDTTVTPEEARLAALWLERPDLWLEQTFGLTMWSKQREILLSIFRNRRTAVKACYSPGKTWVAAAATVAWLHLYEWSAVVTTASSARQVRVNLWNKVHYILDHKQMPFRIVGEAPGTERLQTELRMGPDWLAFGFATDEPKNIQGVHPPSGRILIIVDESDEVEADIHDRLEALMTSDGAHRLDIGNPLNPNGRFAELFRKPGVAKFTIDAFEVIRENPGLPGLVSKTWVDEKRAEWGEDSPLWRSQVLGEFPEAGEDTLIPWSWIRAAQQRWYELQPEGPVIAGVDIAQYGNNESVVCRIAGRYVYPLRAWMGASTTESAGNIKIYAGDAILIRVDSIGIGAGVVDQARLANLPVIGVNVQTKSSQPEKFTNLRAELYWGLREALNPENPNALALPPDDVLAAQLASIKYKIVDSGGKIAIESKDEMRARGLRSPDRADALMLARGTASGMVLVARPVLVGVGTGHWTDGEW